MPKKLLLGLIGTCAVLACEQPNSLASEPTVDPLSAIFYSDTIILNVGGGWHDLSSHVNDPVSGVVWNTPIIETSTTPDGRRMIRCKAKGEGTVSIYAGGKWYSYLIGCHDQGGGA